MSEVRCPIDDVPRALAAAGAAGFWPAPAALSHDLGHTPFGHAGEAVLDRCMEDHGGFDHNRQSLRIVDLLENRYPDFSGLNLTEETREGILKHGAAWSHPIPLPPLREGSDLGAMITRLLGGRSITPAALQRLMSIPLHKSSVCSMACRSSTSKATWSR